MLRPIRHSGPCSRVHVPSSRFFQRLCLSQHLRVAAPWTTGPDAAPCSIAFSRFPSHHRGLGGAFMARRSLVGIACLAATMAAAMIAFRCWHGPPPRGAFYYWQTTWTPAAAANTWHGAGFNRLYLRFFDVAPAPGEISRGGAAIPVAPLELSAPLPQGVTIIPVVFIQNDVLRGGIDASALAAHILVKIAGVATQAQVVVDEVQLDCDWSDATQDRYFALLRAIKAQAPARLQRKVVALSATIRLHQVKYLQRTGVPPVDRGMLMYYNMGKIAAGSSRLSIYNQDDADKYVSWITRYPLPLDLALPVFSWAIQQRGGAVVALLESMVETELAASDLFARSTLTTYSVTRSGLFHGHYFYQGDLVRFETVTPELTRLAARSAADHQPRHAPFRTIAFFDLNPRTMTRYEPSFFPKTLAVF